MSTRGRPRLGPIRTVAAGTPVSRIEIFFDLVFVYGFFNIARFVVQHLTVESLIKGLLVLALLWLCWIGHMLVAQRIRLGEGYAPFIAFAAMTAVLAIALTIPHAFGDGEGVPGPLLFPICYFAIRGLHLWLHWKVARDDPAERRQLVRITGSMIVATVLLLLAGVLPWYVEQFDHFGPRTAVWGLAVAVSYGTGLATGLSGWRLPAPGHFVERFELMIIVALGESVISIGLGSGVLGRPITWPAFLSTIIGIAIVAALWWAYFDIVSPAAEVAMHASRGDARIALARDGYVYLHLPMIAGLMLFALGGEEVLRYLGGPDVDLSTPVHGLGASLLYAGVALYLLGLMGFQLRILGTMTWTRLAVVVVLVAGVPLAGRVSSALALSLLAVVCIALVIAEIFLLADSRYELHAAIWEERRAHEAREAEWRRRHR